MTDLFVWTPLGLLGTTAAFVAFTAAVMIWHTTRTEEIRLRMTALFVAEGVMMLTGLGGPLQWFVQEHHVHFIFKLHVLNDCLLIALYLPAIAAAIDSPLLRPFRDGPAQKALAALSLGLIICVLFAPAEWQHTTIPGLPNLGTGFTVSTGMLNALIFLILVVSYVYGLVATIQSWRAAESTITKKQSFRRGVP